MFLSGLRNRIARAAGAVPQPLPEAASTDAVDLVFSIGLVLRRLEEWATWQPVYEPMSPPTILRTPDAADVRLASQDPRLAALAEKHLTHSVDALASRLGALYTTYTASGEHDPDIDAALADVRVQLASLTAGGGPIPEWCARFLNPIAGNPAG